METFDSFVDLMASMFHASMPELQLWTQTASTLSNIQVLISRAKIDEANVGKLLEETKFYETLKARREIIIGGQSVMEPDIQLFVIIETFWELTYSQFNPPENAQSSVGLVTLPRGDVSNTQYLTELMGELRNAQVAYPECLADWRLNSAVRQIALPLDRAIDLNKLLGRGGANKDQLANSGRILKKFEQLVETVIRFVENSCVRTIERLAYIYLASSFLDQEMEAIIYAN